MSDTRGLFSRLTKRKPIAWDVVDAVSYGALSDAQQHALAGMPVVEAPGDPWDELDPAPETMECIAVHEGKRFYANTEGYKYPRHLVEIVNWPAAEPVCGACGKERCDCAPTFPGEDQR